MIKNYITLNHYLVSAEIQLASHYQTSAVPYKHSSLFLPVSSNDESNFNKTPHSVTNWLEDKFFGTYFIELYILYPISYYTSNKYTAVHANNAVNTYI